MYRHPFRRNAFTLIELLTVIAIITLLIGLVGPAVTRARREANRVATRATLAAITTGCEMFRNDNNEHPKSYGASFGGGSAADQTNWEVAASGQSLSGANLIVDAMVGRDANGYDPSVGKGASQSTASRWFAGIDATTGKARARNSPYVAPDKIKISDTIQDKPKDKWGEYDIDKSMPIADATDMLRAKVFLDKFGYPILYYRADPGASLQTRIRQSTSASTFTTRGDGVYDGRDNMAFTDGSPQSNPGSPSTRHFIYDASTGVAAAEPAGGYSDGFSQFIRSTRSSSFNASGAITFSRPVNADSFILASPGPDGIWGNEDDVNNIDK